MEKIYIEVEKYHETSDGKRIRCIKDNVENCAGCCIQEKLTEFRCSDMLCTKAERDNYRKENLKDFSCNEEEVIFILDDTTL